MIPAFLSHISPHPPAVAAVLFTDLIVLAVAPVCFPNDRSSEASPSLMARARKSYLWPPSTLLVASIQLYSIWIPNDDLDVSASICSRRPHGDIPTSHISNAVGAVATRHLYRSPFDNRLRWAEGSSYYGIPLGICILTAIPGLLLSLILRRTPDEMPGWVIGKENARRSANPLPKVQSRQQT